MATLTNVISNANGNVGIGTTNPTAKLTIVDNTNGGSINLVGRTNDDTAAINFRANGDASTYAYVAPDTNEFRLYHNDGFMSFYPGGSEKVRITSTGNVGIGSSSPSSKFEVLTSAVGLANQPNIIGNFRGDTDGRSLIRVDNTSTSAGAAALQAGISFVAYSNVSSQPSANKHEAQIILGSTGATSVTGGQTGTLQIVAPQDIAFNVSASNTIMTGSNYTAFGYNAMYIARSGNIGIGTTVPTARLHVSGSTDGVFEVDTAGGVTTLYVSGSGNVGIGTTNPTARLHVSGSTIISGSLNVTANITCLSLTETSTEAVKYNIIPLTSQLDNVLKLKPVSFNYKTNDKHSIGLIAEDVSKVYPEFTSDNNDSISYGKITSVLIQSIKELKTIIDNQQKQIENLIDKLK